MVQGKKTTKGKKSEPGNDVKSENKTASPGEKGQSAEEPSDQQKAVREEEKTLRRENERAAEETRGEPPPKDASEQGKTEGKPFPMVGVGASAGGLEALEKLLSQMPDNPGMSFVIVSHTDPGRTSMLPEILQRGTKLPVVTVKRQTKLKANHIYLPPSNKDLMLEDQQLALKEQHRATTVRLPIDTFLRSLAEEWRERSACIILSGTGTDGSQGLRFIKEKGGMAMVQKPESAKYSGMPSSAIATDLADFILPPEKMIPQIMEYFSSERRISVKQETAGESDFPASLSKIVMVLANRVGHDFSMYKKSTLVRRIQRRMSVSRVKDPEQYLSFLYRNPEELEALFKELLIGVTSFFRDAEAFQYIRKKVLPDLLTRNNSQQPFRVWIPGCSTGEEVYSLVILIKECLDEMDLKKEIQVFGTDIDATGIEKAREGLYPQNIAADVNAERLSRFFSKFDSHYRVRKEVREPVVFALQNVLRDPPFSKLDLLVCRNLLIYLESRAQKKLLPLFHYSLKSGGVLFLGSSESVGEFTDIFSSVNKKYNIYRKRDVSPGLQPIVDFPTGGKSIERAMDHMRNHRSAFEPKDPGVSQAMEEILLEEHTPACIVVNRRGEISYIHGRTGKFLEPASGHPSLNVVDMAREGLRFELASALRKVTEKNETVGRENLRVRTNGGFQNFNLTVRPMGRPESLKDMILILLDEIPAPVEPQQVEMREEAEEDANNRVMELERELAKSQQDHRTVLEELETSNEELKSMNEELQSSNEELQSTNEELESSREELQSLNEELTTVNSELHEKINELSKAYDTINDVLNSTRIAILFVDADLQVKRFTNEAKKLINLIENDIGRPLNHISTNLAYDNLLDDISSSMRDLKTIEKEVRTKDGRRYTMRVVPYRTKKNRIEGTILTFLEANLAEASEK